MPPKTCVGLFSDRRQADAAIEELRQLGVGRDEISAAIRGQEGLDRFRGWDDQGNLRTADHDETASGEDRTAAGLTWLLVGGGATIVNPLVSPLIVGGALMAGLAGAVADVSDETVRSSNLEGIARVLYDRGMSEDEARYHAQRVGEGAILLAVDCNRWDPVQIRDILLRHGAEDRAANSRQGNQTSEATEALGR